MKALVLSVLVMLGALPVWGQSAEASKYAPRALVLLSAKPGSVAVMPMSFTVKGKEHLEFIPSSKIKESIAKGGHPILFGEVLSALGEATQTIQNLQAQNAALHQENERLWKVAMKSNPSQPPPRPIIIQQPQSREPSRLEKYMLLRSMFPPRQPTQNLHVTVSDCTRYPALCVGR